MPFDRWQQPREYLGQSIPATLAEDMRDPPPAAGACPLCGRFHEASLAPGGNGPASATTFTDDPVAAMTANGVSWAAVRGVPVVVTFSFLEAPPTGGEYPQFQPFADAQREAARRAFDEWARVSGVTFVEVPASVGGMVQLGIHHMASVGRANVAGYATLPWANEYLASPSGILMMSLEVYGANPASMNQGTDGFFVLLHEIGHSLGLLHPFEARPPLNPALDNTGYTVMSGTRVTPTPTTVGPGDIAAIRSLYGSDEAERNDGISFTLDRATWTFTFTGGAAGEHIIGTSHADIIVGGGGRDRLYGYSGDDRLVGTAETELYSGGDGYDVVDLSRYGVRADIDLIRPTGAFTGSIELSIDGERRVQATANVEGVIGTPFDDRIAGAVFTDRTLRLEGGAGNDTLISRSSTTILAGGPGDDTYIMENASRATIEELPGEGSDTLIAPSRDPLTLPENVENARGASPQSQVWLIGNGGANTLTGGEQPDTLVGGDGDDRLIGGGGTDLLIGGAGVDTAVFGFGSAAARVGVFGGGTRIAIQDPASNSGAVLDTIDLVEFTDGVRALGALTPTAHVFVIHEMETFPGSGAFSPSLTSVAVPRSEVTLNVAAVAGRANRLTLDDGGVQVLASGFDTVTGGAAGDTITTGGGDETVLGGGGNDLIRGEGGNDWLDGDAGDDAIYGGAGNDSVRGLENDDWIDGGPGADDVNGNTGADTVHGGDGDDLWVRGGRDNDLVYGGIGNDPHVNGNIGNDTVYGDDGDDGVFGGQNEDVLYGGAGADTLSGDLGNDTLFGGAGADVFVFRANGGADRVGDFSAAEGDRIQIATGVTWTVGTAPGGEALVTLSTGVSFTLAGVAPGAVVADWFIVGA